jgi:Tfp pilus assembly protein FimT
VLKRTATVRSALNPVYGRGESGVTLLDIAITLSIFALLLVAAVPILPRILAMYRLRGATQEMFSELQKTRLAAVMENNRYRLEVSDGSSQYTIHDDSNNDGLENDGTSSLTTRSLDEDNPGVTLEADGVVSFSPNGTASSPRHIHLTNASGDTSTVVVSGGGRVFIQ